MHDFVYDESRWNRDFTVPHPAERVPERVITPGSMPAKGLFIEDP